VTPAAESEILKAAREMIAGDEAGLAAIGAGQIHATIALAHEVARVADWLEALARRYAPAEP
jgi:hypothetical protein